MRRREFFPALAIASSAFGAAAPKPYGAVPSQRQLAWHAMETYSFLHFTINTFTDREWGYGDEDPNLFNPVQFDADAIVSALKAGGMTGVILTCKHHDGFCLWPTKTTKHSVKSSRWQNGQGDVVKAISESAHRHGLKFGIYVSPWDRNAGTYGSPEYVDMYREQLRELLTGYGPIFEVWHDGANGGDGYYGGVREKRRIDKRTYYGWPKTWDLVRSLQPNAVIFSDVGPDIRWVGNEKGIAGETCWTTITPIAQKGGPPAVGDVDQKLNNVGSRNGEQWLPAECDVSIRPGWFWHEAQNAKVKTSRELFDIYTKSVGRGGSFLLNVPPDQRGLLHASDVGSLEDFGRMLRSTFASNGLRDAKVTANGRRASITHLTDGRRDTFWAAPADVLKTEVVFDLPKPTAFDLVRIREHIPLGQRIDAVSVEVPDGGSGWKSVATATSIGNCRLLRLPEPVTSSRLRLVVTEASASPALTEVGVYTVS